MTPTPPICCEKDMTKGLGGGTGFIFKGLGWPGQENKRANEDSKVHNAARKARNLKTTGQVPPDETITLSDLGVK